MGESNDLKAHIRIVHLGVKRYSCEKCDYVTAASSDLNSHNIICHMDGGMEKFNCMQCDKSLSSRSALRRHVKVIHNKIRAHRCGVRNQDFAQNCDLLKHISAVHRGEKDHRCAECGKAYTR